MNNEFLYEGNIPFCIEDYPPHYKIDKTEKAYYAKELKKNKKKIRELQERLYAESVEGVIVVLQAIDAAGKDSTINHVFGGINPQGINVTSFKQPSKEELAHDFLWRAHRAVPERGKIAVFNRSYYEEVLIVKVHELQENYKMAKRCMSDDQAFFKRRYEQIKNFEEYLYQNSYRVVKIFLHVSKDEQKKRFLDRIDIKEKNWKFSPSDIKERAFFDEYMTAFSDAFVNTATKECPWYIVPADQKWYTRYIVSQIVLKTLEQCSPQYPRLAAENEQMLSACKIELMNENK